MSNLNNACASKDTLNTVGTAKAGLNGPWKWQRYNGYIIDSEGRTVLECHDKEIANAIAKVPEMKAALKTISDLILALVPDEQERLVVEAKKIKRLLAETEG